MTRPLRFSLELVPSLPRVHVHVCMCTFVHVTATRACACVHVYVCACVHARAGIAPRAVPEGCAARGPQTSGRLRRARLEAWGLGKVALRAAFQGSSGRLRCARPSEGSSGELRCARLSICIARSCAVRGSRGLRCARAPGKVSEGSARLRCARPRGRRIPGMAQG